MNAAQEINRLADLLPASWRMSSKIKQKPEQPEVITSSPILPWSSTSQIMINFRLWSQLTPTHQDLLLIREAGWRQREKWFTVGTYQVITLGAVMSAIGELVQADPLGITVSAGLGAIAVNQIWRKNRSNEIQLEADQDALKVAVKRGYTEIMAAKTLLEAIQTVAKLEGRSAPDFVELIRCQNLRAIAGLSNVTVPLETKTR
jgi:Protein of unknown function (DUF3318)